MDISMDTHMDTSMDTHMDMSMDISMDISIKSKASKQARRFMYMNRTQHLPRPSAQEQQPECRRPMEEEKE